MMIMVTVGRVRDYSGVCVSEKRRGGGGRLSTSALKEVAFWV